MKSSLLGVSGQHPGEDVDLITSTGCEHKLQIEYLSYFTPFFVFIRQFLNNERKMLAVNSIPLLFITLCKKH